MPTILPLIKRPKGGITYEHTLTERFPGEVYIGASERNLYVDRYNEVCLCAYYNVRVLGSYDFLPEYHFYQTKNRMCISLYWNLGHVTDESEIIEAYHSLKEAVASPYYKDFCDLKTNIDKAIAERKRFYEQRRTEESIRGGASCGKNLYEAYDEETDQYIQLYVKNRYTVYAVSRSSEPIHDIFDFFPDFIELNTKKLHMIKDYHAVEEQDIPKGTPYCRALENMKSHRLILETLRF